MEFTACHQLPDFCNTVYRYFLQLGVLILFLMSSIFCWQHWKFRSYRQFKSYHMELRILVGIIFGMFTKKPFDTHGIFQEMVNYAKQNQEEGVFVMWFLRPHICIFSEEFSKVFSNEKTAADKPYAYNLIKHFFGNGLVTSQAEVWKVHRKLLNPAFHLGVLKGKFQIFNQNAIELVEELQKVVDTPTVDLLKILKYHSFKIMSESILGLKLNDEKYDSKINTFMEMCDRGSEMLIKRALKPWLYWDFLLPFFSMGRKGLKCATTLRNFTTEVIAELKKSVSVSETAEDLDCERENRKSFGHILLEQNGKNPTFTIEDVRDHLNTFMGAGYDTSAHALMWCLYLLGRHPDVQERAFQEANTVEGEEVTHEDASRLKYIESVFKETLRLYAVIPLYGRKLSKQIQCGKYIFPKGAEIFFFPFMLHRNPEVFADPERFDPDRFSGNTEIRSWMFTPFSEGYRNCIGKNYAIMSAKVALVHILRRFEVTSLDAIEDTELEWTIVLKPVKAPRMLFTSRHV